MGGRYYYFFLIIFSAHEMLTVSHACDCKPCAHFNSQYQRCRCCTYHMVGGKRYTEFPYYGPSSHSLDNTKSGENYGEFTTLNFYLEHQKLERATSEKQTFFQNAQANNKAKDFIRSVKKRLFHVGDLFKSSQTKPEVKTDRLKFFVKPSNYRNLKTSPMSHSVVKNAPVKRDMEAKVWWVSSLPTEIYLGLPMVSSGKKQDSDLALPSMDILKPKESPRS